MFKEEKEFENSSFEFDSVLYEKKFFKEIPVIAIEVNGGEHNGNKRSEFSDKRKAELCKRNKIKLLFIPNSFVKSYEYIIDIIDKIVKEKPEQISFDI